MRYLLLVLTCACACAAPRPKRSVADGVFPVPGTDTAHHRLRYLDGQVSRNDSCMIKLGNRLSPKIPPLYVNGEPLGFC